ncbi:dynein axonemal assembly factor 9-like [Corticium candelabrum]|uniref:dynein axonemal assembly factor 9-like n=1 Tax=Corticium candelabrum TaxID=121492 RepID=UPI002E26B228|nr:dynein axonemal assembly factor 9-like [Corticium candelabrum]
MAAALGYHSRPKSASAPIYTATHSCTRLGAIQRLVRIWRDVDALLLVLGVDSESNEATRRLVNYLLFGLTGHQLTDLSLGFTDEKMEDVVLLIGRDCVHLYCNAWNFPSLLPVVANWRGLQLHCLPKDECSDEDLLEEFKIRKFIQMTNGIKKIGIPYGADDTSSFNNMLIEKWPLIQCYALDDFKTGGFFTMNHDVVDVADRLTSLYTTVDVPSLTYIVTHVLPSFECQWKDMMAVIDIAGSDGIPALSEEQIAEPFNVYYKHGQTQRFVRNEEIIGSYCRPRVHVGLNTCRVAMESVAAQVSSQSSSTISTKTTVGSAAYTGIATHMICHCSEPRGALSCTRTYFFHEGNAKQLPTSDVWQLQQIYMSCIDAVIEAVDTYSHTHSTHESEKMCVRKLRHVVSEKKLKVDNELLKFKSKKNVEFLLIARDFMGRSVELKDGQYCPVIKTVCVTVHDIPSIEHVGKLAGSVSFGESFMDSVILTQSNEADVALSSKVIILTSSILRATSWMANTKASGNEDESHQDVTELVSEGKLKFSVQLVVNNQFVRWLNGTLHLIDNAFVFEHSHLGFVYLPLEQLNRLQLFDEVSKGVALLIVGCNEEIVCHLPSWLRQSGTLVFSITTRISAHKTFYKQFVPRMRSKELNGPKLEDLTALQEEYQDIFKQVCYHHSIRATGSEATLMDKAYNKLPYLSRFVDHLCASKAMHTTIISNNDFPALVSQLLPTRPSTDVHVAASRLMHCIVTVLTGVPGSGKDQLSRSIVSWDKDSTKWVVLRQPFDSCDDDFDIESFQSSLTAITERMGKKLSASMRRTRILVITPGLTDVRHVVGAILHHPEESVREMVKIGAVTACVDSHNCVLRNGLFFPNLLENCAIGLVNNIVWTGLRSESPSNVELLIRACNPTASFFDSQPLKEEAMDSILSDDAFNDTACLHDRLLFHGQALCSPRSTIQPVKGFNKVCLKFCQPLDRRLLTSQLTSLKFENKHDTNDTQPIVYLIKAKVWLTDSLQINNLEFVRQSGWLTLSPSDVGQISSPAHFANGQGGETALPSENCFVFFGTQLTDGWLKNWLRGCKLQMETKKAHRTRSGLTSTEIDSINSAHKHDPLPPGTFYNGSHFLSMDGEKSDKHPCLDQFIDDFLDAQNKEIDRHNSELDQNAVADMFE